MLIQPIVHFRPGAEVLGMSVLEYIFEELVLLQLMGHVLVLILNVLIFYKYI